MKTDFRQLVDRELSGLRWDEARQARVLASLEPKGGTSVKRKMTMSLAFALVLMMMASVALAATLLFSPRYDALQLADQALLEKYGITEEMQPALHHNITEIDGAVVVTYEMVEGIVMRENRFGMYTVTVRDGKAEAAWSMDGMDTVGGLEAPAWGSEQLMMYVQNYAQVGSYMESHGMLQNAPMVTPAPAGVPDKWNQDKQTALSMAKITLEDAVAIGRDAVIVRYGLTEQQAAMLVRFDGSDPDGYGDESTYEIGNGRPLVNLFFHLTQKPGEWVKKDGIYVVTINLLDGAVEDIYYDNGLMGNG